MLHLGLLITKDDDEIIGPWFKENARYFDEIVCLDGSESDVTKTTALAEPSVVYVHERDCPNIIRTDHGLPELALNGDVFEASHTYRVRGPDTYLTLIEAEHGRGWRYYKAYIADDLAGKWTPLAADKDRAFASMSNVRQPNVRWTDSISHGELLRAGVDERLEVEPADPQFLIQGVLDADRSGKPYGEIPWSLGLLIIP
jgi:hypothetical protein